MNTEHTPDEEQAAVLIREYLDAGTRREELRSRIKALLTHVCTHCDGRGSLRINWSGAGQQDLDWRDCGWCMGLGRVPRLIAPAEVGV